MKKQVITIEREVPDDWTDDETRSGLLVHGIVNLDEPCRVSVVSEPIPEPIVLKVTYTLASDKVMGDDGTRFAALVADTLRSDVRWCDGFFHAEVIPQ